MPVLHAVVLGVVQGLSEFLPISSSGHLRITRWLLGWDELTGSSATAFDASVHLGTLVGATAYLRRDVGRCLATVLASLTSRSQWGDGRFCWALAVSAVPAGIVGLSVGGALSGWVRMQTVAVSLIAFGLLLGWADRSASDPAHRSVDDFAYGSALLLGVAQALALQPGVSRSGIVITAARFLGFGREDSVRLAFLMSLPVIAGAGSYGMLGMDAPSSLWPAMTCGAIASAVTGWVAVQFTLSVAGRVGLGPFVLYRVAVGSAVLGILGMGWR